MYTELYTVCKELSSKALHKHYNTQNIFMLMFRLGLGVFQNCEDGESVNIRRDKAKTSLKCSDDGQNGSLGI